MLGISPLVSISESRLGPTRNSSFPCLSAIRALALSTSRIVSPSLSRSPLKFCPACNIAALFSPQMSPDPSYHKIAHSAKVCAARKSPHRNDLTSPEFMWRALYYRAASQICPSFGRSSGARTSKVRKPWPRISLMRTLPLGLRHLRIHEPGRLPETGLHYLSRAPWQWSDQFSPMSPLPGPDPRMSPSESKDRDDQVVSTVSVRAGLKKVERREWWLWLSAVAVTLLLTAGLVSFVVPMIHHTDGAGDGLQLAHAVRGLVGLVLLFDIYVVYQQLQIYRIRQRLVESEELFRLITENAADMIAVIDGSGRRLYNSPAYERLLGYSREELHDSSPMEQIHPEDRPLVAEATKEARCTGVGRRIEYRMRHKDGTWRILESTASSVLNTDGKVERLVIVNRDITSRKRLEEQFRQSQKMEAVG